LPLLGYFFRPLIFYASRRHVPPVEHGGALHRSSRPQHVCPDGRVVCPLKTTGAEISLSNAVLPQCGQLTFWPALTNSSIFLPQVWQRYS
jgi:hypothetical protein